MQDALTLPAGHSDPQDAATQLQTDTAGPVGILGARDACARVRRQQS